MSSLFCPVSLCKKKRVRIHPYKNLRLINPYMDDLRNSPEYWRDQNPVPSCDPPL